MKSPPHDRRLLVLLIVGCVAGCQPAKLPPVAQAAAAADKQAQTALDTSTAKASDFDLQERFARRPSTPGAFAAAAAAARPPSADRAAQYRMSKATTPSSDAARPERQPPP